MSAQSNTREKVLSRIRTATAASAQSGAALHSAYDALPRNYVRKGTRSEAAKLELLTERLREYDATVLECAPADLVAAITEVLATSGRKSFVVPADLPSEWMIPGFDWHVDRNLHDQEVEHVQGVLTAAFCAIADSGTIVLDHGAQQGRRLLTLLPDWHLCVLKTSQVVETLPEYFAQVTSPSTFVTWISGPSATADIEMTRIKGVHGPRFLNVILVHD